MRITKHCLWIFLLWTTAAAAQDPPGLVLDGTRSLNGSRIRVPIEFFGNGHEITAVAFSLDFDTNALGMSPADADGDGVPDAVSFPTGAPSLTLVQLDNGDADGELDVLLADLSGQPLPNGLRLELELEPAASGRVAEFVRFSQAPSPSFGDARGQNVPGTAVVTVAGAGPTAAFSYSPASPQAGERVRFTDGSNGRPTAWSWDFGDGTTSSAKNPTHVYAAEGEYTVTLEVSNGSGNDTVSQVVKVEPGTCFSGDEALCLNGRRFELRIDWRDFDGNTGTGKVVEGVGSADSGLFYFFSANNWEILVKVLNGCSFNDHFWVLGAATTNVEYTLRVTDTETGVVKEYFNPLGRPAAALADTEAFATCPAKGSIVTPQAAARHEVPAGTVSFAKNGGGLEALVKEGTCVAGEDAMCLNRGRFLVEVEWKDFQGVTGTAKAVPLQPGDSGLLYFFSANNWEMLVKVLDGCGLNDRFWVFSAAATNVEYTLKVTDTETGVVKSYFNRLGNLASSITDTDAFATCP